ncbi:MAG: hypothetical protein WCW61_04185 [Patescibacteria group bacterium]|jgi:hypothetical protein
MHEVKELLFGSTKEPTKISEDYFTALVTEANSGKYLHHEAISRCFCRHCGMCGEISKKYVRKLIRMSIALKKPLDISLENPDKLREYYFVTDICEICQQKSKQITEIEVFKIGA